MTDISTPTDAELPPCPFCGGAARHLAEKSGFYTERVICDACDFHITRSQTQSAVERWSRRTPTAGEPVAWRGAVLDLIDECPGLTMAQDRWLSRRVKELDFPSTPHAPQAPQPERKSLTEAEWTARWADHYAEADLPRASWHKRVAATLRKMQAEIDADTLDAKRLRGLIALMESAKGGASLTVNDHLSVYETCKPGEEVCLHWYPRTPVGFIEVEGATVLEVIDEALALQKDER